MQGVDSFPLASLDYVVFAACFVVVSAIGLKKIFR